MVWEAAYAPFGAARPTVEAVAQPWRRPGQYADPETGLSYNRLRTYDPQLGRYLTPDPAGLLGGLHPYRYAHNGPTWDADPLGLWPSLGTVVAAVAAVAVAVVVAAALAPLALGVGAVILTGMAAGATFGFLNEGLNRGFGCTACLVRSTLKGAVVGGLAAVPFVFAGPTVGALAAAGAASGAISYTADWAMNGADPKQWSWKGFGASVALGTALGAIGGKISGGPGTPPVTARVGSPMALAGIPSVATASEVVLVPAVSGAAIGSGVAAGGGAATMMMSGGGGGGSGSEDPSGAAAQGETEPSRQTAKEYPDGSVRTSDGKFAGKTGVVPGTPGVDRAEAAVNARPDWRVVGKEISVRDADGTLRRYDLVARNPDGEYVGIEVKSGTATRTAQQRQVDGNLEAAGGLDAVGERAANANVRRIDKVEVIEVP